MKRAVLLLLLGCETHRAATQQSAEPHPVPAVSPSAAPSASVPAPPPLPHSGELVDLPVEGYGDAVVAVPESAPRARPLLVATHGNYDRPNWQCEEWRRVVGTRAFVLCPRGEARSDSPSRSDVRFTYASNEKLERELEAAIKALEERFAPHVDTKDVVYTGFSLGAIQGAKIAARNPERYPRLVLVEGGYDRWTAESAKAFAKAGKRVLFVCGQKGCQLTAAQSVKLLERAGAQGRTLLADGMGHSYGGAMNELVAENLGWLTEGDDRWSDG